jgi:hypothetical protein
MEKHLQRLFVLTNVLLFSASFVSTSNVSAVGDPGMQSDNLRVAFEAWNFCNEVGQEAPHMGSPRAAQCFDLSQGNPNHIVMNVWYRRYDLPESR